MNLSPFIPSKKREITKKKKGSECLHTLTSLGQFFLSILRIFVSSRTVYNQMTHITHALHLIFILSLTIQITSSSTSSSFLESLYDSSTCVSVRGLSDDCVEAFRKRNEPVLFQKSNNHHIHLRLEDFERKFSSFDSGVNLRMMRGGELMKHDSLRECLSEGSTAVFSGLEDGNVSTEVRDLVMRMESELGTMVHANAYVTPTGTVGLSPHFDVHDFFVIQVQGMKVWDIAAPMLDQAISKEHVHEEDLARSRQVYRWQITLKPGDVLYMPRPRCLRSLDLERPPMSVTTDSLLRCRPTRPMTFAICVAISRVGAITSACGSLNSIFRLFKITVANTTVLPVPLLACAMRSHPNLAMGIARS